MDPCVVRTYSEENKGLAGEKETKYTYIKYVIETQTILVEINIPPFKNFLERKMCVCVSLLF